MQKFNGSLRFKDFFFIPGSQNLQIGRWLLGEKYFHGVVVENFAQLFRIFALNACDDFENLHDGARLVSANHQHFLLPLLLVLLLNGFEFGRDVLVGSVGGPDFTPWRVSFEHYFVVRNRLYDFQIVFILERAAVDANVESKGNHFFGVFQAAIESMHDTTSSDFILIRLDNLNKVVVGGAAVKEEWEFVLVG